MEYPDNHQNINSDFVILPDNVIKYPFEKIPTKIFSNYKDAEKIIAIEIASLIVKKQKENNFAILGLATGSTPTKIYKELVRMHKEEGLSFQNVVCFNLDEYYPMKPDALQSYVRFMKEHLFDHIDIKPENVNIPDGTVSKNKIIEYCNEYEKKIDSYGGIDLQILGIGRNGHIGFNEPGSAADSNTRTITLAYTTLKDAASDFYGEVNVPRRAITMGISTILKAKRILLLAFGEGKSKIIKNAIEGDINSQIPASYLQLHQNVVALLDDASSADLKRVEAPWLFESCDWNNEKLVRKAVLWLCQKVEKPILKLTDKDYNENGMIDLLVDEDAASKCNIKIFNDLQHTITGWPGGKPNADDTNRPERANPYPKKVLIFSPHPDDDVISMGGTFMRLVEQGHEVYTAYQTSGCIAVHDDDVIRYLDFVKDFSNEYKINNVLIDELYAKVRKTLFLKTPGDTDTIEVQRMKTLIRRGEAKAACRFVGVKPENVFFLDMPFYDTGAVVKKELSDADVTIIIDLLQKIKPHQIYAAGDLSDPHGTHRVCLNAINKALTHLKSESWMKDCYIWLYRGAWQEWNIGDVDMAVPLSPDELSKKRKAIFKHQSQKDKALFPGVDDREFWQRAEERNRTTARLYNQLGMAEYEAFEAFVRYKI
ncbi:MAG: glucosamine-6-phosphate deaminase [Bacteroidetes bacterium]|nr:glucosamine-6-phosphate deaminase [Bacteroidota bacterium]